MTANSEYLSDKSVQNLINSCVKCGKCLTSCPIYLVTGDEKTGARGKLTLLNKVLEADTQLFPSLRTIADICLYCLNCQSSCPQAMDMGRIIPFMRKLTQSNVSGKIAHSFIENKLSDSAFIHKLSQRTRIFFELLSKTVPDDRGIHLRFPLPNIPRKRLLPHFSKQPNLEQIPEVIEGKPGKPRVGLFLGCLYNYLDREVSLSLVTILQKLQFTIITPRTQTCCGLPHFSLGIEEAAVKLSRINTDAFLQFDCDFVISSCPTCVEMLSIHYKDLSDERDHNILSQKTMDSLSFLCEWEQELKPLLRKRPEHEFATYHDPCHLTGKLGVRDQPRKLLRILYGDNFHEMMNPDSCCGGGGSFSIKHYDLAQLIGQKKRDNIIQWQERVDKNYQKRTKHPPQFTLATACPGCDIQLNDLLHQPCPTIRIKHIIDLVAKSLKCS